MTAFIIIIFCFSLSWLGTGFFIRVAKNGDLMDIPNSRSSHSTPVPRGGGIVFAALFLLSMLMILLISPHGNSRFLLAIIVGGLIVAALGWIDDVRGLSPKTRLAGQFLAVAIALLLLGGFPSLNLGLTRIHLGMFGFPLALVAGVWLINLYNFMDGIDGLAAGEAILVSFAAGLLLLRGGEPRLSMILFMLAAFVGGFLFWNWSPAKIFMGDVGSGFLGFVFAVFIIVGERSGSAPALVWAVLLSVFAVDTTLTLLKRIFQRKNLAQAHRDHFYQQAIISGFDHNRVAIVFLTTAGLLCILVWFFQQYVLPIFILTYIFLCVLWILMYSKMSTHSK